MSENSKFSNYISDFFGFSDKILDEKYSSNSIFLVFWFLNNIFNFFSANNIFKLSD